MWPPALTFGLPSPALGCLVGPWVFGHSRCALLRLPGVCPASGPPRGGEGCAAATLRAPAWVCERASLDPRWCPWSAPGRPSGARGRAVVFPLNPVSSSGPRHGGVRVSRGGGRGGKRSLVVCSSRRWRLRGAGSAPALTAHTPLCGGPLTYTADPFPSRPVEDWRLLVCLRGPRRRDDRVRDGAPSVRKPSLAIQEGALGYRIPQPLPLLSVQWPPWRLPEHVGRNSPSPLWEEGVMGAPAPRWGRVLA